MVMDMAKHIALHMFSPKQFMAFPPQEKHRMLQLSTGKFDDSVLPPFFLNHIPNPDMVTKNKLRIKC